MELLIAPDKRSRRVLFRLVGAPKAVERAIPRAWDESGAVLSKRLTTLLTTGPRNGRRYMHRGVEITASAPGEPPAKRSGRLARSVEYRTRGAQMEFGETAEYAGFLEDGTRKMAARPHVSRVVKTTSGDVYQILARHISQAAKAR
ncbi:hypothetical protein [Lysobacter sp. GCM10012299]|uniref:hypothetical protein n=1 Tax=Lysobacter sp. GCM10012299 TaxID=3317333 RepID=UPI00361934BB